LALGGFYLLKSLAGGRLKGERFEVGKTKTGKRKKAQARD
jgi:hypothetical protein